MVPFLLLALIAQDEPVPTTTVPATPPTAEAPAEITPAGAPSDDYEFVGWCKGVLSGHMALAERVQTVLPLDEVQQKIGAAYLKGYDQALRIGGKSRSPEAREAAKRAEQAARANWDQAMRADLQLAADTYLAWQLPGRCEHAAKRVAGRDDLFRMAPSVEDADDAPISSGASAAAEPAPAPAEAVPAVAAAPAAAPAESSLLNPTLLTTEGGLNSTPSGGLISVDATTEPPSNAAPSALAGVEAPAEAPLNAAPSELASIETPATPAPTPAETAEPAAAVAPAATQGGDAKPADKAESSDKLVKMPKKGRLLPFGRK